MCDECEEFPAQYVAYFNKAGGKLWRPAQKSPRPGHGRSAFVRSSRCRSLCARCASSPVTIRRRLVRRQRKGASDVSRLRNGCAVVRRDGSRSRARGDPWDRGRPARSFGGTLAPGKRKCPGGRAGRPRSRRLVSSARRRARNEPTHIADHCAGTRFPAQAGIFRCGIDQGLCGGRRGRACAQRLRSGNPGTGASEMAVRADAALAKGEGGPLPVCRSASRTCSATKGVSTTACTHILDTFVPTYESTVSANLWRDGAVMLGKLNNDEFAMGSSNDCISAPSSRRGGARILTPSLCRAVRRAGRPAAVASNICVRAIGTDTGGSIRQPAAFTGIMGIKPTYGRVLALRHRSRCVVAGSGRFDGAHRRDRRHAAELMAGSTIASDHALRVDETMHATTRQTMTRG